MSDAFVYKWTNKKTGKFYIGKHKGTPDDGYISSGKTFLDAYWADPHNFTREIIFFGTDKECLLEEGKLVKEAVASVGYKGIYNRTHWQIIKGWKRTCLHCGAWCDPANEEWAKDFELYHFTNCQSLKSPKVKKPKLTNKEWRELRNKVKQAEIIEAADSIEKANIEYIKKTIKDMSVKQLRAEETQLDLAIKKLLKEVNELREEKSQVIKQRISLQKTTKVAL